MSLVLAGLLAQCLVAVVAVLAACLAPAARRSALAGGASALLGAAGAVTGAAALAGSQGLVQVEASLPLPLTFELTPLGGLFMTLAGVVVAIAAVFGIGHAHGAGASRTAWTAYACFAVGMQWVPAAADAVSFLLAWEVMALASTVLLLADHATRPAVRSAALWYAVMTHLSFVLLAAGFGVLAAASGSLRFDQMAAQPASGMTASIGFLLLAGGFVTKAGLVPVHVWLPRAHPEAPSHVSAVMSAAMVKMGIYGLFLTTLRLLPEGPRWWGAALLALGAVSAAYGILQASVATDLKRLLAYSTTENVGLMVTAIAVAMVLRGAGQHQVAVVALVAALLLTVSHAAFKTVLFLGAGAVLHATGERDLDRLGGLHARMPWTGTAFAVGAAGAAALPFTSGFVAEWALLQSLIHGGGRADRLVAVALPLTVGLVALTAGLALLTFVKAYGIGFLALPRSDGAAGAQECAPSMRCAMTAGAVLVVILGLLPGPLVSALAPALLPAVPSHGLEGAALALPAVQGLVDPLALGGLAVAVLVAVAVIARHLSRRHPRRDTDLVWGCGSSRAGARQEYTATSYAEPLVRIFADTLRPRRQFDVTSWDQSPHIVREMVFEQQVVDVVEDRAYTPLTRRVLRWGQLAGQLHNGSIHRYLWFSFVALVLVLVVVTL